MSSILFEIKNGIAFITLNRPEKFNSFNREMALLMQARLDEAASLHEVRCVYITGAGKAFCAGQDISELVGEQRIEIKQILSEHYNPIVRRIHRSAQGFLRRANISELVGRTGLYQACAEQRFPQHLGGTTRAGGQVPAKSSQHRRLPGRHQRIP